MGWKIVEINQSQYCHVFLENLIIEKDNDTKISIPLADIDTIIINNYQLTLTVKLLNAISKYNIVLIICDQKSLPESQFIPLIGNYNTLKIFDQQIHWTHNFKAQLWQEIIKIKINNQRLLLSIFKNNIETDNYFNELIQNVKFYDATNREGHAAKVYWHQLYGVDFNRKDDSFINSCLNYGYAILRAYIARSIVKKGLDPRISLFHKSFHNHFALASDLIEPFRFVIDYYVYKYVYLTKNTNFGKIKDELINLMNSQVILNNKTYYLNNAIDIFIDTIVNQTSLPIIQFIYDTNS